ncbi:MAG: putative Ig domain-containing protein [Kiritimatiellia bacterium]
MKEAHKSVLVRAYALALAGVLFAGTVLAATHPLGWGLNGDRQASPVPTNVMDDASGIAAGYYHSLAFKDGRAWAWGLNTSGQTNVPIAAQSGVSQVAGGGSFSLALKDDGSVVAWGAGIVATNVPASLSGGVSQIAAGESHALALKDGGIVAWGDSTYGQTNVPPALTSGVAAISAGGFYSLALKTNGEVQVFGIAETNENEYGIRDVPPEALGGVTNIAAGRWHALALKDGGVIAWGAPFFDATNVPAEAASGVAAIAAGDLFSIALKTNGTLVIWGAADTNFGFGQLPIPNYASNGVGAIAAGAGHCLAVCGAMPPRFLDAYTPNAFLGQPYSNGFVHAAGDPAVRYYTYGSWPGWLTLDENTGDLGGTPPELGLRSFTVVISNSYGRATNSYEVNVLEPPKGPPIFITTNLPNGIVGAWYTNQIVVTNGGTFSVADGSFPAGLAMDTNGWIEGTPLQVETLQVIVSVTNLAGSSNRLFTVAIDPPAGAPVFTTTNPLPSGVLGQPYSFQLETENYPTNFGVASGALPAGLGITSAGMITGTPAVAGTADFELVAENMAGAATNGYSLHINGPPVFTTDSPLPNGEIDLSYWQQIEATGDAVFSFFSGDLPDGLALDPTGLLSGMPTELGLFTFTVRATNVYGGSNRVFELTIDDSVGPPVFFTTNPLPGGVVAQAYSNQIVASRGPTFSLFDGALPGGLSLATNGWLTGTPTNTGAFEFTVQATNDYGGSNRTYNLQIFGPPVFSTTNPLPGGVVGTAYAQQIEATESPTFSLSGGALPGGLSLAANGWLTGTPTNTGAFEFTVQATNDYGWSNRVFNLAVNARILAILNRAEVNVRENGEGRFYVKLDESPAEPTTVTVARVSGDADVSVSNGAALVFTAANWDTWQMATLAAADDPDATDGTATFQIAAPGGSTNLAATELDDDIGSNLALASAGSTISGGISPARTIDGIHVVRANYGYTAWTNVPPGTMTLDLNATATVSRVRLLNYDWDERVHRYQIESSPDNANWTLLADASAGEHRGWEDWAVADESIRYLRFTGLSNSASFAVCINEWEVVGRLAGQDPPWFTARPRYTNGAVRLAWTNPNGGSVEIWRATNITQNPVFWTNLATTTASPWTNEAPLMPSYYQLRLP